MSKQPARTKLSAMDDVFAAATPPAADQTPREASEPSASPTVKKSDGRSLQATGRTHQFATRIKAETHQKMYEIVQREKEAGNPRFTLAELIELAIDAYEEKRSR